MLLLRVVPLIHVQVVLAVHLLTIVVVVFVPLALRLQVHLLQADVRDQHIIAVLVLLPAAILLAVAVDLLVVILLVVVDLPAVILRVAAVAVLVVVLIVVDQPVQVVVILLVAVAAVLAVALIVVVLPVQVVEEVPAGVVVEDN